VRINVGGDERQRATKSRFFLERDDHQRHRLGLHARDGFTLILLRGVEGRTIGHLSTGEAAIGQDEHVRLETRHHQPIANRRAALDIRVERQQRLRIPAGHMASLRHRLPQPPAEIVDALAHCAGAIQHTGTIQLSGHIADD